MAAMQCETCGNTYDKAFQVVQAGRSHTFDSFECAIAALAPSCEHCGLRVIGHGVEKDGRIFCCAHCAAAEGITVLRDRAEGPGDHAAGTRRLGGGPPSFLWLGLALGAGAAVAMLLDPSRGAARRAKLRDQALARGRDVVEGVKRRATDAKQRAQGAIHETKARLEEGAVSDELLAERVRAEIGRPVSHPGALQVRAHDGHVELRGPILASEVAPLMASVRKVRGVKEIINHLEVHQTPGNVPALQGTGSRQSH